MKIKIKTNISSEYEEPILTINAPEMTDEIKTVVDYVSKLGTLPSQIVANKDNEIYFVDLEKVICFFSEDKYNYIRTKDDVYRLKYKLYEIEEIFGGGDFIRISKSCIININQVHSFDTSILGTIIVKLKDDTQEKVSKRNVPQIMKMLKERGKMI